MWAQAQSIDAAYPPLFASVTGVTEGDFLNVREKPYYKSKKLGSLPFNAYIGVDGCQQVNNSVWCRVYQIAQLFYEDFHQGWVNAKYLRDKNSGYVIIDGKKNCDYALGCVNGMCDVVIGYDMDDEAYKVTTLHRVQIKRDQLRGESNFGAMNPEEDGLCNSQRFIEDYLKNNNG
jgi:hypothetical protein